MRLILVTIGSIFVSTVLIGCKDSSDEENDITNEMDADWIAHADMRGNEESRTKYCSSFCRSHGLQNCGASMCDVATYQCKHLYWKNASKGEVCFGPETHCPEREPVSCEHAQLTQVPLNAITSSKSGIRYTLVKHLGSGHCNDARLAISDRGESVVLKCLRNQNDYESCTSATIPAEFVRHEQYRALEIPVPTAIEHFRIESPKSGMRIQHCLVMSQVGESLESFRKRFKGSMPLEHVAAIGLTIVGWARRAHAGGISHSDMHVGNLAFSRPGHTEDLVLIDLGLTRELPGGDNRLTDELIQRDAIYIAHTLMYLFTGDRVFWNVKYRHEMASELPMSDIRTRFAAMEGNAIELFNILEHAMTHRSVNWNFIIRTLEDLRTVATRPVVDTSPLRA